jgi:hypothetical protein
MGHQAPGLGRRILDEGFLEDPTTTAAQDVCNRRNCCHLPNVRIDTATAKDLSVKIRKIELKQRLGLIGCSFARASNITSLLQTLKYSSHGTDATQSPRRRD